MNEVVQDGSAPVSATPLLAYDPARRYLAGGRLNLGGSLLAFLGGLAASVVAGVLVWVWLRLHLPSLYVLPMIAQGIFVGIAIAWLCRTLRVRNVPVVIGIAICCGVFSAFCLQGVVYLRSVYELSTDVKVKLWSEGVAEDSPRTQQLLARIDAAPYRAFDVMVLLPAGARQGGFLGFMQIREGEVWAFTIVQALVCAGVATGLGKHLMDRPFCESCGAWFGEPYVAARVPAGVGEALARAIEADDPAATIALVHRWQQERATHYARAYVCHCPKCRRAVAQVRNDKTKVKKAARSAYGRFFVSAETVQALRASPAVEVPEPGANDALPEYAPAPEPLEGTA